jgi:hypothetical protein
LGIFGLNEPSDDEVLAGLGVGVELFIGLGTGVGLGNGYGVSLTNGVGTGVRLGDSEGIGDADGELGAVLTDGVIDTCTAGVGITDPPTDRSVPSLHPAVIVAATNIPPRTEATCNL